MEILIMTNKKERADRQTKRINFRLTELEYEKLKVSSSSYDLTVSAYAKKLALKSNLRIANSAFFCGFFDYFFCKKSKVLNWFLWGIKGGSVAPSFQA